MKTDPNALPMRKDGQIDTRPLEVEEWLEGLPYVDFQRTSGLLHEALSATNKVQLKPVVRRELLSLYHQPYQYYLDSQIKAGAQHTLQSIETMQQQLLMMKQLAADLALAARLVMDDSLNRKSLWGQNKLPLDILQQAMSYLSHALIFNFLEYAPTPRNVWKQLNALYKLAEDLEQQHISIAVPGDGRGHTTIEHTYSKIVLAEVVDPYHLPFGAIWEIYEQLDDWIGQTKLQPFEPINNPSGLFVVNLDSDIPPLPCNKFDTSKAGPSHRLLNAGGLKPVIEHHINQLPAYTNNDKLKLSSHYATNLLAYMLRAWSLPPKRNHTREVKTGTVRITCGINPVHFHMNEGRDFMHEFGADAARPVADGLDVSGDEYDISMDSTVSNYSVDQWEIVNEGQDGYALLKNSRPIYTLRVGDLIGVKPFNDTEQQFWALGTIRWLMADSRQKYRLGIQLLAKRAKPVAVRPVNGDQDTGYLRAFLIEQTGKPVLVTSSGFYTQGRNIELAWKDKRQRLKTGELVEATIGFEQFSLSS